MFTISFPIILRSPHTLPCAITKNIPLPNNPHTLQRFPLPRIHLPIRPQHIRVSHPHSSLRTPHLPHGFCYRAQQAPWSLPKGLKLIPQRLRFRVPQPYPITGLECLPNAPAFCPPVSLIPLPLSILMQLLPYCRRAHPQLIWRAKD